MNPLKQYVKLLLPATMKSAAIYGPKVPVYTEEITCPRVHGDERACLARVSALWTVSVSQCARP